MVGEKGTMMNAGAGTEEGIAGTSFKTIEELAAAYQGKSQEHQNLEKKLGEQGSELGKLRGQAETLATILKENLTKGKQSETPKTPLPVDYDAEVKATKKELQGLDPMDDQFNTKHADLVDKLAKIAALSQHEKTLGMASEMLKKELGERDVRAAQKAFFDANPTFNAPEMQAKIQEYIAKDTTGMSDSLSAFREIERDEAIVRATEMEKENAEYKKLIELNKGKLESGKVITSGEGISQQKTKPLKVTGKDLDAGMMAALNTARVGG